MPRASKKQNEIDQNNVMDVLLRDPLCTVDSIAEKCSLSTQQVYRILRDFEEKEIIYGKPMMINLEKVGKKRFIIMAKRSGTAPDTNSLDFSLHTVEMLKKIRGNKLDIIPEDDYTCSGAYDMVTVFLADSSLDALMYLDLLRSVSNNYFSRFDLSEVMYTTRKCMVPTPEIRSFVDYISELSVYSEQYKHP